MPRQPPRICPAPRCQTLVEGGGRCAAHARPAWVGSTRSGLPRNWNKLRLAALGRDGYRCRTCGAAATGVDHVVPRTEGGSHDLSNLAAICVSCHKTKTSAEGHRGKHKT